MKRDLFFLLAGFLLMSVVGFTVTTVNTVEHYNDLDATSFSVDCGGGDNYRAVITLKDPTGKHTSTLTSWTTAAAGTSCSFKGHAKDDVTETCASNKSAFETTLAGWCSQANSHSDAVLSN